MLRTLDLCSAGSKVESLGQYKSQWLLEQVVSAWPLFVPPSSRKRFPAGLDFCPPWHRLCGTRASVR